MSTREQTQSIAVNEEEKLLIEILAVANGSKPASVARSLLFRGLVQFIADRQVREPGLLEDEVRQQLADLISEDP